MDPADVRARSCMARSACSHGPGRRAAPAGVDSARTPALASTRASGTQSATMMARVTPGVDRDEDVSVEGTASPSARYPAAILGPDEHVPTPWTCGPKTRLERGAECRGRPAPVVDDGLGVVTDVEAEIEGLSNGAAETPPCRVVTATSTPRSDRRSQRTKGTEGVSGTPADPTERGTADGRRCGGLRGLALVPDRGGDHRKERPPPPWRCAGRAATRRSRRARPSHHRGRCPPPDAGPRASAQDLGERAPAPARRRAPPATRARTPAPAAARRPEAVPVHGAVEPGAAAQRPDGEAGRGSGASGCAGWSSPSGRPTRRSSASWSPRSPLDNHNIYICNIKWRY